MFKVKGVVRLERKNEAGEILEVIEKENVFTILGLQKSLNVVDVADTYNRSRVFSSGITGSPLYISTQTTSPSEGNPVVTDLVGEALWDFDNPLPRITWEDATTSLPMYGELRARLDAPGASRTFQTVAVVDYTFQAVLTGNSSWNTNSTLAARVPGLSQDTAYAHSYVLLDSPVVQGALEIIDIFYRLYFIPGNGQGVPQGGSLVRNIGRRLFGLTDIDPWSGTSAFPTIVNVDNAEDFYEVPAIVPQNRLISDFYTKNFVSSSTYNETTTESTRVFDSPDLTAQTGLAIKSLIYTGGEEQVYAVTARNMVDPGRTPLQTSWAKRDGGLPFFSDSDFALGVGRLTLSETWTGDYPEMYKVIVTTSGGIGVSEYRIERMLFTGFNGNSWFQIPARCPQLGVSNQSQFPVDIFPGSYGMNQRKKFIKHNRRQVIYYNTLGVSLVDILDSSIFRHLGANTDTINPLDKLDVTDIAQVYSDGTIIYVACRDTGLWEIDTTKDLGDTGYVTNPYAGNAYGVTGVNYLGSTEVVIATVSGITTKSQSYATFSNPTSARITSEGWSSVKWIEGNVAPGFVNGEICLMSEVGSNDRQYLWWDRASGLIIEGANTTFSSPARFEQISGEVSTIQCSPLTGWWAFSYVTSPNSSTSWYFSFGRTSFGSSTLIPCGFLLTSEFSSDNSYANIGEFIPGFDSSDRAVAALYITMTDTDTSSANTSALRYAFESTTNSSIAIINFANTTTETDTATCVRNQSTLVPLQPERMLPLDIEEDLWTTFGSVFISKFENWTQYGWNGSAWVAGSTTSKPTHVAEEEILNGVFVGFDDKAATNAFFATDFYTVPLLNGVLMDNAKEISLSTTIFGNNYRYQVDFPTGGSQLSVPVGSPFQIVAPGASEGGFLEMDVTSANAIRVFLDGVEVPFSNVLDDGSNPPAAGIISVDKPTGAIIFNAADAGKAITGYYSYSLSI